MQQEQSRLKNIIDASATSSLASVLKELLLLAYGWLTE